LGQVTNLIDLLICISTEFR